MLSNELNLFRTDVVVGGGIRLPSYLPSYGEVSPLFASDVRCNEFARRTAETFNAVGEIFPNVNLAARAGDFRDHFHPKLLRSCGCLKKAFLTLHAAIFGPSIACRIVTAESSARGTARSRIQTDAFPQLGLAVNIRKLPLKRESKSLLYRAIEGEENLLTLMRSAVATERLELAQARLFARTNAPWSAPLREAARPLRMFAL